MRYIHSMPRIYVLIFAFSIMLSCLHAQDHYFKQDLLVRELYQQLNLPTLDQVKPGQKIFIPVRTAHFKFCKNRSDSLMISTKTYVHFKKNPTESLFEIRDTGEGYSFHELHLPKSFEGDELQERAHIMREFLLTTVEEGMSCSRYRRRFDVYNKELRPLLKILGAKSFRELASTYAYSEASQKRVDATKNLDDPNFYGSDLLDTDLTSSNQNSTTTSN